MTEVVSFQTALEMSASYKKRHLLLGNGFSIACNPNIFTYRSLYEQALEAHFLAIPEAARMFEVFETKDFEVVIRALEEAGKTLPVFDPSAQRTADKMESQAGELKTALVCTIADNHPDVPNHIADEKFWACRQFLSHFLNAKNDGKVYTLNYDLLLYWATLHDDPPFSDSLSLNINDGFGYGVAGDELNYVTWQGESSARHQRTHYLHGAIHLFDAGSDLKKYTWRDKGVPILAQARSAMEEGMYPLFVAEGSSEQKLTKIKHSAYLYHCYKSFSSQMEQKDQALFVFGHSFLDNDNHILRKISEGKVAHLFVSVLGALDNESKLSYFERVNALARQRNGNASLNVTFFDAGSANVWGASV
jgi:hypothetical protein